jgi:hypothetical protein
VIHGNRADGRGFGTAINHRLKPDLARTTFESYLGDPIEGHSG